MRLLPMVTVVLCTCDLALGATATPRVACERAVDARLPGSLAVGGGGDGVMEAIARDHFTFYQIMPAFDSGAAFAGTLRASSHAGAEAFPERSIRSDVAELFNGQSPESLALNVSDLAHTLKHKTGNIAVSRSLR